MVHPAISPAGNGATVFLIRQQLGAVDAADDVYLILVWRGSTAKDRHFWIGSHSDISMANSYALPRCGKGAVDGWLVFTNVYTP